MIVIRIPKLREEIGAGDVAERLIRIIGVKPCEPCQERKRRLNEAVKFAPVDEKEVG